MYVLIEKKKFRRLPLDVKSHRLQKKYGHSIEPVSVMEGFTFLIILRNKKPSS